jgi:hypothetical protein
LLLLLLAAAVQGDAFDDGRKLQGVNVSGQWPNRLV